MTSIVLTLKVISFRKLVATRQFSVEVAELRHQLTFSYRLAGPRAHRYRKSFCMSQQEVLHPTAPPERWHNAISYSGRPGEGWTEYLPCYESCVSQALLPQLLEFCMPQNGFTELI